jgi:photosystem II stability/assembly factor-like uncharacterized protein
MRLVFGSFRALFALLILLALASPAFAILPPAYTDAPLRAVRFLDQNHGVVVGDHGVVWTTLDSGKSWDRMKSGTKASLRGLDFFDPFHGWAVGRTELADGAGSSGVVLFTTDGGLSWTEINATSLPGLNLVKFFSESTGIAAGDGTPANPSGLFATDDGGKTWQPVSGPRATSWTAAHFTSMSSGALAGVGSQLHHYAKGLQTPTTADLTGGRSIRGLAFDDTLGVAVGDGGTILCTTTGTKWTHADTGLPAAAADCLDFNCVSRIGSVVWAAGRPGSVVLKSEDAGISWKICKTAWNLPLLAIHAQSATDIWAVGELGTILKSSDGGTSWKVQLCGGQRSAVLFAHAASRNVPMDAVAALSGRDGYFAVGYAVSETDGKDSFRLASAMRIAGGAAGESNRAFKIPAHLSDSDAPALLAEWNKQYDGQANAVLVRRLIATMRIWSPDVVVSDLLSSSSGPCEHLVLQAVQEAFKKADDPTICPEQLEILGLKVCGPKKLYALSNGTTEPGQPAGTQSKPTEIMLDQTVFAKTLVNTVQGHAEPACAVLGEGVYPPNSRKFQLVSHRMPGCEKHIDMLQGLDLAEGGSARRKLPAFDPSMNEWFKTAEATMGVRQNLDGLLRTANSTIGLERALTLAAEKIRKMPDDVACQTAVALSRQFASQGQWVVAREFALIATSRYEAFPESASAARWLNKYYASAEARMRADKASLVVMQYGGASGVVQASGSSAVKFSDGEAMQAWCRACLEMEGKLKAFGPAYTRTPDALLSNLSARRQLGLTVNAAKTLTDCFADATQAKEMAPGQDLWRDCLAAELWLSDSTSIAKQPKPLAVCPKVAEKPFLDGKLGDACWQNLVPIEATIMAGETPGYTTKTYFVHDADFLYFAVECTHPNGQAHPKAEKRRRDEDLRGQDRIDIVLDTDRDYQTYFRFQVDQRGCVADDCTGDASWNPNWFVAVEPTPTGWTAEIAIPRSELTAGPFKNNAVWGMNVTRVVPGQGCQTWSGPAQATPRAEGIGLLRFQAEK